MKILHFIPKFSSTSQSFIYDLLLRLDEIDHVDNTVLTYKRIQENERPYDDVKIIKPNTLTERLMYKILRKIGFKRIDAPNVRALRRELNKQKDYDIFHAHFGNSAYKAFIADDSVEFASKTVVSIHGTDIIKNFASKKKYREVLISAANRGCTFLANSQFLALKAIELGLPRECIKIVYNTVNEKFLNAERELPYVDGPLRIISIGRLIDVKGHEYLIRSVPVLKRNIKNIQLSIVGDGINLNKLKNLVHDLGVNENVHFMGSVSHDKLPEILSNHHIYVQPSIIYDKTGQEESFGIVILEALAVGLPVIVTNTGGMPEVVSFSSSSWAKIIPQKDEISIAKAVKEIINNKKSFKLKDPARNNILEKYTAEKQTEALLDIYSEVIGNYTDET